jgi:hypothetical protein
MPDSEKPWARPEIDLPAVAARFVVSELLPLDVPELVAEVAALRNERDDALLVLSSAQTGWDVMRQERDEAQAQRQALVSSNAHLRACCEHVVEQRDAACEALKAWEAWEADWIEDDAAWNTPDGLPRLTQKLADALTPGLQDQRTTALALCATRESSQKPTLVSSLPDVTP